MACEETVRLIDGIFGHTDTSRAIASVINLVHKELMHDPDFELSKLGKVAVLASLTKALTAFALLQTVTHKRRIKQVKSTILWQGLVIEEETNQQALIEYEHHPQKKSHNVKKYKSDRQLMDTNNNNATISDSSSTVSDSDNHEDVVYELQGILADSSLSQNNKNNSSSNLSVVLSSNHNNNEVSNTPYNMYEIITTTKRTTTKTTTIRPIHPNNSDQPVKAKYITVQSDEMDNESFVAVVNENGNNKNSKYVDDMPGVWSKYPAMNDQTTTQDIDNSILLSSISKKLTRKKLERKESYGWENQNGESVMDIDEPLGPSTLMTSTSTTLRSTATSTSSLSSPRITDYDDDDDDESIEDEDNYKKQQNHNNKSRYLSNSSSSSKGNLKKSKSKWGFNIDSIKPKKSNSNFSLSFYPTKKSVNERLPPNSAPPNKRRNSSGSSIFPTMTPLSSNSNNNNNHPYPRSQKLNRSNSITSMASISRTTTTTTYSTTPQPTPTCSNSALSSYDHSSNNSSDVSHSAYASCSSSPSASTSTRSEKKDKDVSSSSPRRIRVIKSLPLIQTSKPRSLEQEPDPRNFPRQHIILNIGHFMRYASAAYGESFMRVFRIGDMPSVLPTSHHHHPNHHAFAHHTGVMVQDILLSSYTDSSVLSMHHPSIHALVHYVTVDHRTKSIVLTCRGTLGLSDVLTDLSFTYTDFTLPTDSTRHFQAHDGMLDAAQLLAKEKGKVYQAIRQGLEMYPEYGLVLCGHSLGGGVVSLLSVLWSEDRQTFLEKEPSTTVSAALTHDPVPFVTSRLSGLPAGRPVHCYAYGPPCVMSFELSQYCGQGLVTSIVNGYDVVSCLSWGLIKDLKNVATSLHVESHTAESIISRIIGRYNRASGKSNNNDNKDPSSSQQQQYASREEEEEEQWLWATIKTMRADMHAEKLYPPMTVYHVETIPQLVQSHTLHTQSSLPHSSTKQSQYRKAHMTTLTLCDDIQARFSEINFSRSMFIDHTPSLYEKSIRNLLRGYFGQEGAYENS
ncbi:hypothetical protein BJ944DRAFT_257870 [Cunninghamella echinulata]|nr:hypothetical protein BJ944DRAFT_257870 [Cunninghamella echinulata]